jgi:PhoPQ-activated pathogenicity-related protein
MLKKICSVVLSALLLQAAAVHAFAGTSAGKDARRAEKVRAQLARLGAGPDARIRVELRDKTKLEGYVSRAGADGFVVTDKAGNATPVAYPQVRKAQGNNLSTGAKIAIGVGIGAGVTLLILYLIATSDD